jgi:hypothetical protein
VTAPARSTRRRVERPNPVPTVDDLTPAEKLMHEALLAVIAFGPELGTGRPVSFTSTARTLTAQVVAAAQETPR